MGCHTLQITIATKICLHIVLAKIKYYLKTKRRIIELQIIKSWWPFVNYGTKIVLPLQLF